MYMFWCQTHLVKGPKTGRPFKDTRKTSSITGLAATRQGATSQTEVSHAFSVIRERFLDLMQVIRRMLAHTNNFW